MSRIIERIAGLVLLVIGVLVLASEPLLDFVRGLGVSDDVLRWWPILCVGLSLFFLVPSLMGGANRRLRAGMVIPGALLAGVGSALLYTSLADRWSAWAYLWTVIPFSFGLGMYAAGWIADAPAFKWIGSGIAVGGVVAYLVFAIAFGGEAFRVIAAIGILGLGLALSIGGLADRLSRKSPIA
ncbi:MAG: hypothetical protein H0U86_16465 [Chloroflexi bacterium]|nr:hypothetical protein [Chloroflexota bacterium]